MILTKKEIDFAKNLATRYIDYIKELKYPFLTEDIFAKTAKNFLEQDPLYKKVKYDYGITKGVFILEKYNFVIKFAFADETNYVEIEEFIFQKAVDKSWSDLFCSVIFLMDYKDITVVLQEKVDVDAESYSDKEKYLDEPDEIDNDLLALEEHIEEIGATSCEGFDEPYYLRNTLLSYYSLEQVKEIYAFFKEFKINDIHTNNWGFINDKPKIFDYSGFWFN